MSDPNAPQGDQVPPPPPPVELTMAPPTERSAALPPIGDPFAVPAEERTNVAGLIGFIAAVLGFCIPVLPSLVALVLGIVGVMQPRRGLAIAAIVLSVIQFILLGVIAVVVAKAVQSGAFQTVVTVAIAESELEQALATENAGNEVFTVGAPSTFSANDAWGVAFRTEVVEVDGARAVFIWSAGPDETFDTADDFVAASSPSDAARKAGKPLPEID